jgi:hypothetical protein
VLGFVGAGVWMLIHYRRWQQLAWFPVLWLSLTMLLFQNINALYFWYPVDMKRFNMHGLFWGMFAAMVLYVIISPLFKPRPAEELPETQAEPAFPYVPLAAGTVVALALFIFAAGFINGEQTMRSANTRWPRWAWTEGPFPGTK